MADAPIPANTTGEYETFELLVSEKDAAGYRVTIIEAPAGEANAICRLDPADAEFQDVLLLLEDDNVDAAFLAEFGGYLFDELFGGDIAALYRASLSMVRGQEKRLRVRLRLEPPELAALPWEYLYDPQEDSFLATSPETALVRYIPMRLPSRATAVNLPLRVLVVISNPRDVTPLDVKQEQEIIQQALQERIDHQEIDLRFLERATIAEIAEMMRGFNPHVFHFIGHGQFQGDRAYVVLVDEHDRALRVEERAFREFFQGTPDTRLAIFNACQTGTVSSTQPLVGLAPRLLQRKLSAVVAMQYPIPDTAALIFAREFYRSLAQGYPVDAAVSEARKGIFLETGGGGRDWGTPVLFLRAKDGRLFAVATASAPEIIPPPEPAPPPEISGFVGRELELAYYAAEVARANLAVITGMPGVGKTALAAALARRCADAQKIFWHAFNEHEGIEEVIWKLAGFLYWNGAEDLWRMLQGIQAQSGQYPPVEILLDYLIQLLRVGGYLLCLDDLHFITVSELELIGKMVQQLQGTEIKFIIAAQTAPEFVPLAKTAPLGELSSADAQQLCRARGLALSGELQEKLYAQTGGNAQFLVLAIDALLSVQHPERMIARLTETSDIERYLMSVVDERLTDIERQIMSGVAVLLGYAGTRAAIEAVLDTGGLRRALIDLSNRNLLMTGEGEWGKEYWQNVLVRAFYYSLQSRAEREARHRRAAHYYQSAEVEPLRAAQQFMLAEDFNAAAAELTANARELVRRGQARQLRTLLEQFSRAQVDTQWWIEINLALGAAYVPLGEGQKARACYQEALDSLATLPGSLEMHERVDLMTVLDKLDEDEKPRGLSDIWTKLEGDEGSEAPELRRLRARAYQGNGLVAFLESAYAEAQSHFARALSILENSDERWELANCLINIGMTYWHEGNLAAALRSFRKAHSIFRKLADQHMMAICLNNIGLVHRSQGFYNAALQDYQTSLESQREIGNKYGIATALINIGELHYQQGDYAEAQAALTEALAISREIGDRFREALSLTNTGDVYYGLAEYETARQNYHDALRICAEIGDREGVAWNLVGIGAGYLAQQEHAAALSDVERALEIAQEIGAAEVRGKALRLLGEIYGALPDSSPPRPPDAYFEESLALLREMGAEGEVARTLAGYGRYYLAHGDRARGEELRWQARDILGRLGMKGELARLEKV